MINVQNEIDDDDTIFVPRPPNIQLVPGTMERIADDKSIPTAAIKGFKIYLRLFLKQIP